ncbi:hypothetical protein V493_05089 [Pseudogymnoascus sp. VKM F-4281 (FW-2241)]|nr:hypothetical protein V493_05089 [Pseudogymnoascus sp. VKM F-4281 (FW-2241)]
MLLPRDGVAANVPGPLELAGQNRVQQIVAGMLIPTIVAIIIFLCRVYSRALVLKKWWIDDTLTLISMALMIVLVGLGIGATKYGSGYHYADIPKDDLSHLKAIFWSINLIHPFTMASCKAGVCFFYLRVFINKWMRLLTFATLGIIVSWSIPCFFIILFQCRPIKGAWAPDQTNLNCNSVTPTLYLTGIANILIDMLLIITVGPQILKLKLPRRQKTSLLFVLTLGWMAMFAAVIRLFRINDGIGSKDPYWTSYDTGIWNALELAIANICVSIPACKPVLDLLFPNLMSSLGRDRPVDPNYRGNVSLQTTAALARAKAELEQSLDGRAPPRSELGSVQSNNVLLTADIEMGTQRRESNATGGWNGEEADKRGSPCGSTEEILPHDRPRRNV